MPKPKKESFSERLVRIRKARGLTQYDLEAMTGISRRMIVHYETNARKLNPDTVIKLAKALKVSIDELLGYKALQDKGTVNRWAVKKAKLLEGLSPADQKTVSRMIDSLHGKKSKNG